MRKDSALLGATFKVIFLICGVLYLSINLVKAELRIVELKVPTQMPTFTLKDQFGKYFTRESLKGSWTLSLLGFTHCPDVCPFVLSNLEAVISRMSVSVRPDNTPRVVFIGVDPDRDENLLGDYVRHFNKKFLGVTGTHSELRKFVNGVDGFYRIGKPDKDGNYDVRHSASVILSNPDGRIEAKLSPPLDPDEVARYLTQQQIIYRRSKGGMSIPNDE